MSHTLRQAEQKCSAFPEWLPLLQCVEVGGQQDRNTATGNPPQHADRQMPPHPAVVSIGRHPLLERAPAHVLHQTERRGKIGTRPVTRRYSRIEYSNRRAGFAHVPRHCAREFDYKPDPGAQFCDLSRAGAALALFRCRARIRSASTSLVDFSREMSMADTIFGKIIAGQIPCHKVYEDDRVLAFLDINPLTRGHTLVVPKEPAETLDKLSDESAAALGRVLPRIWSRRDRSNRSDAIQRPREQRPRGTPGRLPRSFPHHPATGRRRRSRPQLESRRAGREGRLGVGKVDHGCVAKSALTCRFYVPGRLQLRLDSERTNVGFRPATCFSLPPTMQRALNSDAAASAIPKCPTGIQGLDEITHGGLPRGRLP